MERVGSVERVTTSEAGPSRERPGAPWWAVVSAALAPVSLTAGWVIAGAVQPPEYSAVRQSLSVLASHGGAERWIMTTSLFVLGACHVVTALGLTSLRPAARLVLGGAGVSGIALAALPQPAGGSASEHVASVVIGSVLIAVWPAFVGSSGRSQSFVLSVRGSAAATTVFVALTVAFLISAQGGNYFGLVERVGITPETVWPLVVVLALRRSARREVSVS
ncbi:DUF998 domain-containing protein [Rhodococcus coprophilus]|uniref:Integral membrane protein n=1 Tax=Rhodococcus coprophilus TaxID=38310 RepID=A0A2X4XAD8_9NOCA|nr:integral membrane protein [Rhodococcus coprophilus]